MSDFGYIPSAPTQAGGSNTGVFSAGDIYNLADEDKWTNTDGLVLIQYQSFTDVTEVLFTSIRESEFRVHMAVANRIQAINSSHRFQARLSNDGGSSYISTNYDFSYEGNRDDGDSLSVRTTAGGDFGYITNNQKLDHQAGAICYFYDLGNSAKYSKTTSESTWFDNSSNASGFAYGIGVLHVAETHNAIRFSQSGGMTGSIALYGLKENLF